MRGLSSRQLEVAKLVGVGLCNKDIANRLGISVGTAKVHLHNIFQKLSIVNRVQLAVLLQQETRVKSHE